MYYYQKEDIRAWIRSLNKTEAPHEEIHLLISANNNEGFTPQAAA